VLTLEEPRPTSDDFAAEFTMLRPRVALRCPRCGSDSFRIDGKPKPEDMITCTGCHTGITYREAENATLSRARYAQNIKSLGRHLGKP
jgi:hypothetical protein